MGGDWKHGICGCCNDCGACCCSWLCPCVVMGQVADKLGNSCCLYGAAFFVPVVNWLCLCSQRGQVRQHHGISGSSCGDLACVCCCTCCALAQMKQEMN